MARRSVRPRPWSAGLVATMAAGGIFGCQEASAPPHPPGDEAAPTATAAEAGPARREALAPLPPEPARTGPHGEMALDEQQRRLDGLGLSLEPPKGVDPNVWRRSIPKDNAMTAARVELGRQLYFDPRLSKDDTVACATCHDVSRGFTDQRNTSEGIGGQVGRRNAPTPVNALFFQTQFLDGRSITLEDQAKLPILNPIEMGMPDEAAVVAKVAAIPEYQRAFQQAYGRAVTYDDIARAIGAFERTLVFMDSPFDRFVAGDEGAISAEAKAGWVLYNGKARCVSCHQINLESPIGSDDKFHNIGVSARHQDFERLAKEALAALAKDDSEETIDRLALETDLSELGRFVVTRNRADIGAFKTSQVRNVGITGPYMHDGSMQTLWDVMDHYNKGGEPNPFLDGGIEALNLTEEEIDQVVAFLFTLTDVRFAEDNERERRRQQERAAKHRPFRDEALAERRELDFERRLKEGAKK